MGLLRGVNIPDMEKPNPKTLERNGGLIRLPIGFRFQPTDEELLVHYLKRKNHSLPLPASVIPQLEQDVFRTNPWDLPGDLREKRYFFSRRRKENMNNNCSSTSSSSSTSVAAGCGYWKAVGEDKQIMAALGSSQILGINKCFIFYQGKRRTPWVMHHYSLVDYYSLTHLLPSKKYCMMPVGDWAVCRIYQKKKKAKRSGSKTQESYKGGEIMRNMSKLDSKIDKQTHDMGHPAQASSSSSSSSSSGITQINALPHQFHQQATSHYYNDNIFIQQL